MRSPTALGTVLALTLIQLLLVGPVHAQCEWSPDFGVPGMTNPVRALAVFDDGTGPALYAAGGFLAAGGVPASRIARWDGESWSPLGTGLDSVVYDLAVFDDGAGPALYAGGAFSAAGGVPASRIARWTGTTWEEVGGGITGNWVIALTVFDDGTGPALVAGGDFTAADGTVANRIASWDGSSWSALENDLTGPVFALAPFDDGTGELLYAGGFLSVFGDPTTEYIARWDGSRWSGLDPNSVGTNGSVLALATFDDGAGEDLYAGGYFEEAGGNPAGFIARWDGAAWSTLGSGMNAGVSALAVFDDGTGQALYAGGRFTTAGGVDAAHVARWDGSSWSALGAGVDGCASNVDCVEALAVYDAGDGAALFAGGDFTSAGGSASSYIATWSCEAAVGVEPGVALAPPRARAWPNPFTTHLRVGGVAGEARISNVELFDAAGRLVAEISPTEGQGVTVWEARDAAGAPVPAGVYFVRVTGSGETSTLRVVRAR